VRLKEPSPPPTENPWLTELAYAWGDVEEALDAIPPDAEGAVVGHQLARAFRVEAVCNFDDWGAPYTYYLLYFDITDFAARVAADALEGSEVLISLIEEHTPDWHSGRDVIVCRVPPEALSEGRICRRGFQKQPADREPSLEDLPLSKPLEAKMDYLQRGDRGQYWLTQIEAEFYDELRETGLTFAVQPWIEGAGGLYHPDFMFFWDGQPHVVELDGHDYHSTKPQRPTTPRGNDGSWHAASASTASPAPKSDGACASASPS